MKTGLFFSLRFLELTIWCSHQLRFLLQVQFVWFFLVRVENLLGFPSKIYQATEYNLLEREFST